MAVTIRQATSCDASALAQLAALTFPLACPPGSEPEDIAAFICAELGEGSFEQYLNDPRRALFVAEDVSDHGGGADGILGSGEGHLLAYTMLVNSPPSHDDVAAVIGGLAAIELSKCYARPGCHGQGVAARLMAVSLAWAHEQGARQLWLGVNEENIRARTFYEKQGFTIAGKKSFYLGSRIENDYVMVRPA